MCSSDLWLIVANVAVFVLDQVLVLRTVAANGAVVGQSRPVSLFGYFSVDTAIFHGEVWRLLTYQFLHANRQHILFNMVALFLFGPVVEPALGRGRYLAFYLLAGAAGGLLLSGCYALGLPFAADPTQPLVGASAGIFGVLVAAAYVAPDVDLMILGLIPVPARVAAWGMIGVAAFTVLTDGLNAGGQAAHLGGAAAGYVLITRPRLLRFAAPRRRTAAHRPRRHFS